MRFTILLILTVLLTGCAKEPVASNTMAESAINSATALEQSLPATCNTASIKTQIQAIKTQINAITQSCETEKQVITEQKVKWKMAFFGLLVVILIYVIKRLSITW